MGLNQEEIQFLHPDRIILGAAERKQNGSDKMFKKQEVNVHGVAGGRELEIEFSRLSAQSMDFFFHFQNSIRHRLFIPPGED